METEFPRLCDGELVDRLAHPGKKVRAVLDTDTYNEIDDQFALAYAICSPEALELLAVHAAPFLNPRSISAGDGMEKSYEEILRVFERMEVPSDRFVYKGSGAFMSEADAPVESPAADHLIELAMQDDGDPLYVLTIGAPTNVASAILLKPEIIRRIVVVWMGGQPHYWYTAHEFNCSQDPHASRVLFDSGVPLVQLPDKHVTDTLRTTAAELEAHLKGKSKLGDYLFEIFCGYSEDHFAWSKPIYDIATVAWLVNPKWFLSELTPAPILTQDDTLSRDGRRHLMRVMIRLDRDGIFRDLFTKLAKLP